MVVVWNRKSVEVSDCLMGKFHYLLRLKRAMVLNVGFLEFIVLTDREIEWLFRRNWLVFMMYVILIGVSVEILM